MKKILMLSTLMLSISSWAQFSTSSDASTQVTNQIAVNGKSFIVNWIVSIPSANSVNAASEQCKGEVYQAIADKIRIEAEVSDIGAIGSSIVSKCIGGKVDFYAEPKAVAAE